MDTKLKVSRNPRTLLGIYNSFGPTPNSKDKVGTERHTIFNLTFSVVGFLSLLIRDAYEKASPGVPFTLEATTSGSRDRYSRLGFEVSPTHDCI